MSRDIKDIAADIRSNLKREFPACTFAVRIERYSMGQSLHVALMKAPFEAIDKARVTNGDPDRNYAQLNEYQLRQDPDVWDGICNGAPLTAEAWGAMKRVDEIVNAENWDRSDSMTDYFDVNYYTHLNIGRWDKPFQVVAQIN